MTVVELGVTNGEKCVVAAGGGSGAGPARSPAGPVILLAVQHSRPAPGLHQQLINSEMFLNSEFDLMVFISSSDYSLIPFEIH